MIPDRYCLTGSTGLKLIVHPDRNEQEVKQVLHVTVPRPVIVLAPVEVADRRIYPIRLCLREEPLLESRSPPRIQCRDQSHAGIPAESRSIGGFEDDRRIAYLQGRSQCQVVAWIAREQLEEVACPVEWKTIRASDSRGLGKGQAVKNGIVEVGSMMLGNPCLLPPFRIRGPCAIQPKALHILHRGERERPKRAGGRFHGFERGQFVFDPFRYRPVFRNQKRGNGTR